MKKRWMLAMVLTLCALLEGTGAALEPTAEEMQLADRWAAAKFDGVVQEKQAEVKFGIKVLQNNDPLQQNQRNGAPMKIGEKEYDHGLYAHAVSRLRVTLPKAAKRLTAQIGVDTHAGGGSIFFIVERDGNEIYKSEICHCGEEAKTLDVALDGAKEFFLCVSDAGDGIACDQACWALATLEMADGSSIKLGDLDVIQNFESRDFEPIFPFSFQYGGKDSNSFLKDWKKTVTETKADGKTLRTLTFQEPDGPLQVICLLTRYDKYPMVEWTLKFKNTSDKDTPIIENVRMIDTRFSRKPFALQDEGGWSERQYDAKIFNEQHEFLLHHAKGAPYSRDDYHPYARKLSPGANFQIRTEGGRATGVGFPYFNLQCGPDHGWIVVLGWSGQWNASFERQSEFDIRVHAGQEDSHFKLLPNEELSSPTAVVQPWKRATWYDAQNVWREWMIQCNVPKTDGKVIDHHVAACSSHWYAEMIQTDTEKQKMFIDRYLEEGIPLDYWWMDAGWYKCDGIWPKTGTWEVDEARFPGGLRPITDYGRSKGVKTILWFEPERVGEGTWLSQTHPEWCSGGEKGGLLNLGDPAVQDWAIETFNGIIKKEGVDLYRQDFNTMPLDGWQKRDTPDRKGVTEIKHVEGYLKFWDSSLERNPGIRIDTCASGGNRNDLETLRRAVPLLRSDFLLEPISQQCHTYGISFWIPFYGTGQRGFSDYQLRSLMMPYMNLCHDVRDKSSDWAALRKMLKNWNECLVPHYGGDYYPLTQYSTEDDAWMGWQFNSPKKNSGAIQMFRREGSPFDSGMFKLYGLNPDASYVFTDVDTNRSFTVRGKTAMEQGIRLTVPQKRGACIWTYRVGR